MGTRQIDITPVSSPLRAAFAISRGAKTSAETVQVRVQQGGATGWGECVPYARYGETTATVTAAIEAMRDVIEGGLTRDELQIRMLAGAARCAVDCAERPCGNWPACRNRGRWRRR